MWYIPPIPFSTTNNRSTSFDRSNFILFFINTACYTNSKTERNLAGSSSYVSRHIFRKLLNTSSSNNVSLRTYKSSYLPKFYISKSLQTLL